jgi:FkbM family methyltransferase
MLANETKSRIADRLGSLLGDALFGALTAATALLPPNGRRHVRRVASLRMPGALRDVTLNGVRLRFERAALIQSHALDYLEPETFAWLDSTMRDGEVLWDIGANIGLYTLWCAHRFPDARVVAFEPNALTYPLLVRHVIANGVADRVMALPIALSGGDPALLSFRLRTLTPGLAANQLDVAGAPPMLDGREAARYSVIAGSGDRLASLLALPAPQHLKLDVDGIEPQILAGASRLLASVRSVLVEHEHQPNLDALERPLLAAGLVEDVSFRHRGSGRNRVYRRPEG